MVLFRAMNISQYVIDSSATVVNDVVVPLFVGIVVGVIVSIVTFYISMKKTEKINENEISNLIQSLLLEININQNRLQPLSDCVDKVLDNNNYEYSETESIPDKLCFERTVYSSLLDKIGLLNNEIIAKMILYYSETKDVEEEYKNLEIIHGASHGFLNYLIIDSEFNEKLGRDSSPSIDEIVEFFRHTKKVYDLGADLIITMKDK